MIDSSKLTISHPFLEEIQKTVQVDVGLTHFQISNVGLIRARDTESFTVSRKERAIRLAITSRWTGNEDVLALQFCDEETASDAENRLRLAAQGTSFVQAEDFQITDEELCAILLDPGFPRIVDRVAQLLQLAAPPPDN